MPLSETIDEITSILKSYILDNQCLFCLPIGKEDCPVKHL